ncbi:hypothetical protein E2C01_100300 [Portunus trituberculatus]|uniref:Uncharacterized protein n=1 Tax=Portunus trituberculatus TaxID=210409 RepID=A0A5B7KD00_PORTR|nr:hypothetical protein [Portunus trituberculatus]
MQADRLLNTPGVADTKACLRRNPGTPVGSRSRSRLMDNTCTTHSPVQNNNSISNSSSSLVQLTTKMPCNVAWRS